MKEHPMGHHYKLSEVWHCYACGQTSNVGRFCTLCGRDRHTAADAARWHHFLTADAVIVAKR
jgi:hypothetical protein